MSVIALHLQFYAIEVGRFLPMLGKLIFNRWSDCFQLVRTLVNFIAMKSATGTLNNAAACVDELFLFRFKNVPPHQVGFRPIRLRRETMKSAAHIVQRQQAVFTFNVLNDFSPMLVVIELGAQHLEAKSECAQLLADMILQDDFALADVVTVIEETRQHMVTKTEALVDTL